VLIYFGYPEAHEDDAERAVRAGLAVIDAVGRLASREALNVRLGIASGLVVVGDLIGTGAAQERGVVGETPNLAARLQGLAAPDTLVIADSTRRQIGALFEIDDLGQRALAGFSEPQRAWRIVGESGVLSRFEALRSEATPLVGRDEELDLLLSRWQQAKAGKGRVVLVSGEPGIGKSRLSAALSQRIQGDPHIRLRYFCSPYHQDSALYPVRGFVRISQSAGKASRMVTSNSTVFLVDVDNTLLDNDRIQADLRRHLEREFGAACRDRYWAILEQLFADLGYRDYLGALQRYRVEHPEDIHLLSMSSYLVDYPFANRLYPGSLDVLERFREWGRTVILSDGDVVFQPRKVERSGIFEAVDGHVLIYIHKEAELADVERRYPAAHYVLVDDKPRILAAVKKAWGDRVTTILPRQGQFARAPDAASYPTADLTIERIGDLVAYDIPALLATTNKGER